MGREARRKPQAMIIAPEKFKDMQLALARREIIQMRARQALAAAEEQIKTTMKAANLDPEKRYTLDVKRHSVLEQT